MPRISPREFVTSAVSAAALSSLPLGRALANAAGQDTSQGEVRLIDDPRWKDQGMENLAKSMSAMLQPCGSTAGYLGESSKTRSVPLTFIPYDAWAYRQATSMQVWNLLAQT